MNRALLITLALLLVLPGSALAKKKKGSAQDFYDTNSPTLATVEFSQEFVAGGQPQRTTSSTDGVVISADGLVLISGIVRFPQRGPGRLSSGSLPELTNIRLHFSDGREHSAVVVTFDSDLNLGLLRITDADPKRPFPHVQFDDRWEPKIGEAVQSLTLYTAEYGREAVYAPMAVNAKLSTPQDVWSLSGATTNMVGSPLWGPKGSVVGVVARVPMSAGAARQVRPELSGAVGLPYRRFADWLQGATAQGAVAEAAPEEPDNAGWLGVEFQALERPLAQHLGISPGGGILVTRVIPGSPADAAGLAALDVLVQLDGERIAVNQESDLNGFIERVRSAEAGTTVRFTREQRGGGTDEVPVTLAASPRTELQAQRTEDEDFELTVRELTLDVLLGQRLEPQTPGVVVDGLSSAGWAGLAGLSGGMIIQRINQHDVTDLASFEAAMAQVKEERPEKVLFFVRFRRDTRFFVAEPDWSELDEG